MNKWCCIIICILVSMFLLKFTLFGNLNQLKVWEGTGEVGCYLTKYYIFENNIYIEVKNNYINKSSINEILFSLKLKKVKKSIYVKNKKAEYNYNENEKIEIYLEKKINQDKHSIESIIYYYK